MQYYAVKSRDANPGYNETASALKPAASFGYRWTDALWRDEEMLRFIRFTMTPKEYPLTHGLKIQFKVRQSTEQCHVASPVGGRHIGKCILSLFSAPLNHLCCLRDDEKKILFPAPKKTQLLVGTCLQLMCEYLTGAVHQNVSLQHQ